MPAWSHLLLLLLTCACAGQHRPTQHLHRHQKSHAFEAGARTRRSSASMLFKNDSQFNYQYYHGVKEHHHSSWPIKRVAEIPGDIVIGGLHMVHERQDQLICGPVMPQGGLQAAEVMLFTVDEVNRRGIMPKGIQLGTYILDDCDKDTYGLQQAVDFIKGSITNIDDDAVKCKDGSSPEIHNKVISGVVGAASSVTSIQVANLLRLFKIPQISFFSTSPELSNKQRFEYFSRTIPSDHYQTMAMAKIVERLGWKYMSIIYEESNYGIKAFEELERLLSNRSICVAVKEKLTKDSGVAGAGDYDHIVEKLLAKPKAKGVIIFGSDQEVAGLMRAVKRMGATGKFSWIGSDGWSARALVSDGNEAEVEGTLSVQPQAHPVIGFEEYFLNLTVQTNHRNPWFAEFWEDHFKCRFRGSLATPYNQNYSRNCTGEERLTKENTQFEAQLQFVSDAVMAFAHAFKDMHKYVCGEDFVGLCENMTSINGETLLRFLRNVSFTGLTGDGFKFNQHGDGPARYNIIHYKQVSRGQYEWITVGYFHDEHIDLNMEEIQFQLDNPTPPDSICSLPCEKGQMKKYVEGESCCWTCHECGQYQILDPLDETRCKVCPNGTLPDPEHLVCVELPEEYLRFTSYWAIGAMSFALIGIVMATAVLVAFIRNNDTPVVRASGRELSYVLIAGLLLCYGLTFILMQKPTTLICGIQEFMIGLCFSIVYGALLTKTNRISRIFNASDRTAKRPNFISPKSQLLICSGIVMVQVIINTIWLLVSPPAAIHHHPTREDNLLVCKASINASYMIAFSYPILLVIICTVYAVLTRKIPEAFNESKYIGFSMYTTCIIWLAFIPIYFTTSQHVALRITSMSVTISLSATVTIVCLFTPKLYIILLHPEKNVRQSMMNQSKYQSVAKSSQNGPLGGTTVVNNGGQVVAKKAVENGSVELKERIPLMQGKQGLAADIVASNVCSNCSAQQSASPTNRKVLSFSEQPQSSAGPKEKAETSCQTDSAVMPVNRDCSTQTVTQWLQISLNCPPLALTQEVPDVVLKANSEKERQQWLVALGSAKASLANRQRRQRISSASTILTDPSTQAIPQQLMDKTSEEAQALKSKKSELRLYCDLLMQQLHTIKSTNNIEHFADQEEDGSQLLGATCDTFIRTLDELMEMADSKHGIYDLGGANGYSRRHSRERSATPVSNSLKQNHQPRLSSESSRTSPLSIAETGEPEEGFKSLFGNNCEPTVSHANSPAKEATNKNPDHFFPLKTLFPSGKNGKIEVQSFVMACSDIITIYDCLGKASFSPIKTEMKGLIKSLKTKHASNPDAFTFVIDIIADEDRISKASLPNSATTALKWLSRHLMFLHNFLQIFAESEETTKQCLSLAYEQTLSAHHDTIIESVFAVAFQTAPSRAAFIQALLLGQGHHQPKLSYENQQDNFTSRVVPYLAQYLESLDHCLIALTKNLAPTT